MELKVLLAVFLVWLAYRGGFQNGYLKGYDFRLREDVGWKKFLDEK